MLDPGADAGSVDHYGDRPVLEVIRAYAHKFFGMLLELGMDTRTRNHIDWTALHVSAAYGDIKTFLILDQFLGTSAEFVGLFEVKC